ncbi:hypothetical protein GCM10008097_21360 [Mycetocola manganoxydans]|nr:hypothetical protein GCM10008097_21360 [Mycetocola manganoxydans]
MPKHRKASRDVRTTPTTFPLRVPVEGWRREYLAQSNARGLCEATFRIDFEAYYQ